MRRTLTVPANLYRTILDATLVRFEASGPVHSSGFELEENLQQMRMGREDFDMVAEILDQLDWTATPREVVIETDGDLMRNILSLAIIGTADKLWTVIQGEVDSRRDLNEYTGYTRQIDALTDLLRTVQHDPDEPARKSKQQAQDGGA